MVNDLAGGWGILMTSAYYPRVLPLQACFLGLGNGGANTFFGERNDEAKTFSGNENDGAATFFGEKMTGPRLFGGLKITHFPLCRTINFAPSLRE